MGLLDSLFMHDGAREAVRVGEEIILYDRFRSDIETLAAWMREQGAEPGQRIALCFRGGQLYWQWIAHLAAIRLGLVHATVSNPVNLTAMSALAGFDLAVGDTDDLPLTKENFPRLRFAPGSLAPVAEQLALLPAPLKNSAEDSAVRLAFTTGTTGKPKLVEWNAEMMTKRITQVSQTAKIVSSTRLCSLLGLSTTGGFRYPLATWLAGGCVMMAGNSHAGRRGPTFIEQYCNLLVSSPAQLQAALDRVTGAWINKQDRRILILGGRLPVTLRDDALERACLSIAVSYGSTETGNVAVGDAAMIDLHPGAVGEIQPGAMVQIVDIEDRLKPAGEEGVVRVRTDLMCEKYAGTNGAQATANSFRDGWFYPGDQGILFSNGLLAITGRTAETINIGGTKYSAIELEMRLGGIAGLTDLCVFGMKLKDRDLLTVAVVCNDDVDLLALREQIVARLPQRKALLLARMPSIPRNAMGKVPRKILAERVAAIYSQERDSRSNAALVTGNIADV